MEIPRHNELNDTQKDFLISAINQVDKDERFVGLGVGGSIVNGIVDEFSDLDLVIAVEPLHYDQVLAERSRIAERFGQLLAGFTGEHVGDNRIFICLYGPPLLHVDLKFISLQDVFLEDRRPLIICDKNGKLAKEVCKITEKSPVSDIQWIEDRFWVWVHYAAVKIARGELFEVLDFLAFLRRTVLAPLAFNESGESGFGVRKIEQKIPQFLLEPLKNTTGSYDKTSLKAALKASIEFYDRQRERFPESLNLNNRARDYAIDFLERI